MQYMKGPPGVLIIAPHGAPRNDINTAPLAGAIVEQLGCSAIINTTIDRKKRDYNYVHDALADDKFIQFLVKTLDSAPKTLVVWIHGSTSNALQRNSLDYKPVDCLIGYGQPWMRTIYKKDVTTFMTVCKQRGLKAMPAHPFAENFRGAAYYNMNTIFRNVERYSSLKKVRSMQLEFSPDRRQIGQIPATANIVAAAIQSIV